MYYTYITTYLPSFACKNGELPMKKLFVTLTVSLLALSMQNAFASPRKLVIHNQTNVDAGAYVAEQVPPRHPAKANSTNYISWTEVRMACLGRSVDDECPAMIKMAINTSNEMNLGIVYLNVKTGNITPKKVNKYGYTLTVNGPGEATLTQDATQDA